jgi:hypothetical protein
MSTIRELIKSVRDRIDRLGNLEEDRFSILKDLSLIISEDGEQESGQDLLLRVLERREYFANYEQIINDFTRKLGLFPYSDPEYFSLADAIAYEFHRPLNMKDVVFHRPQSRVYRLLLEGESVALSAPTSFGKSLIIDAIIASEKYHNILVIVPTLALIDETRRRLTSKFKGKYKVLTHQGQYLEKRNVFVVTQERLLDFGSLDIIDFFVLDEFYKLSPGRDDDNRCWILNQAFYKLVKAKKPFYMLGPGIAGLSLEKAHKLEFRFISEPYHTVSSELIAVQLNGRTELQALYDLCKTLHEPTIIFCTSPGRTSEVIKYFLQEGYKEQVSTSVLQAADWIEQNYSHEWNFPIGLKSGIGVHHGRIPRSLGQYVVRAFNEEEVRLLICTSTLIEGVNTKAKNIVIFDNTINKDEIDFFTFNNIRGRSGRMFEHFVGHVYVFHDSPQMELPIVDIPAFTQNDIPDSLLIQLESDDLTERSKERMKKILAQDVLEIETLKENVGIDVDSQIQLAEKILESPDDYNSLLLWRRYPKKEQLEFICELIWTYFGGARLGANSVFSSKQLRFKISELRKRIPTKVQIENQLSYDRSKKENVDPDSVVQRVLDFQRLWANFHFPRLLRAIGKIQSDIFTKLGMKIGSYDHFASEVENLFLPPTIIALDEYGLPIELGRKLETILGKSENVDQAIEILGKLELKSLKIHPFEAYLIDDLIKSS